MMDLGFLVIPLTLLVGFLVGRKIPSKTGIVSSAIAGAVIYVAGLMVLSGPTAVLIFDFTTQILMVTVGAISTVFGWFIGANYEMFKNSTKKRKSQ